MVMERWGLERKRWQWSKAACYTFTAESQPASTKSKHVSKERAELSIPLKSIDLKKFQDRPELALVRNNLSPLVLLYFPRQPLHLRYLYRLSTSVRPCAYRSRQTIYSPNLDPQIVFPDLSCTHLTNLDSGGAKSPDLLRTASVSLAHFLSIFTSILSFRNIAL
ncbi:hypothetical protein LENED_005278 [Lentinula edodes]|uniref:Uncharacterized protein n=1 Tax=Lentinula edodes TaxID=5353 RepID=A0A1Q3E8G6_LENED|nr:hypothetical protein LENED_005278 [Lentinula edodes]